MSDLADFLSQSLQRDAEQLSGINVIYFSQGRKKKNCRKKRTMPQQMIRKSQRCEV